MLTNFVHQSTSIIRKLKANKVSVVFLLINDFFLLLGRWKRDISTKIQTRNSLK